MKNSLVLATVGLTFWAFCASAQSLPPGVQDVVKLVKAGVSEDVVLAQIQHNAAYYNLTTDQVIYLQDQGVTQSEIKALIGGGGASPGAASPLPAPVPAAVPPGPPMAGVPVTSPSGPPTLDAFRGQLAPFG